MTTPAQIDEHLEDEPPILIDAHVHLYECFDRTTFFDAALANFQTASQTLGLPDNTPGCLMLTETAKDHAFDSLIAQQKLDGGRWRFRETGEGRALVAAMDGQDVLTVIAGRQIVTREGLEVLALCSNDSFADKLPLEQTIEKVIDADALPVLPYGVGKWSGTRGKVIDSMLNSPLANKMMLGDNAGRLALTGEPKQFAQARKQGIWVLPGTDPLPFPRQARGVGRFGMVLKNGIDQTRPAASLKSILSNLNAQAQTYGRADGLISFLSLQFGMQLRKRLNKR
jgi:hypothetical protein